MDVALGATPFLILDLNPRRHGIVWDTNRGTSLDLGTERGLKLRPGDEYF